MRLQRQVLVLPGTLAIITILMISCGNPAPFVAPIATVVPSPSPALRDRPPVITASYAGQEQRGVLGSYCWNGCPDTLFLIPSQPMTVPPSAKIQVETSERIPPHQLLVTFFLVDASQDMPWSDPNVLALGARTELARVSPRSATQFEFQMPDRQGDYAVSLFGEWQTGPDYGPDVSYGFHIVVNASVR